MARPESDASQDHSPVFRTVGPLVRQDTGETLVERVELADTFPTRLIGLQFRAGLAALSGLLIVPCHSIHTMFMRFPIDVAYLDADGKVLKVVAGVRPWRAAAAKGSRAALEMPAGTAERLGESLRVGVSLALPEAGERRSIRFLSPARFSDDPS